MKLLDVQLSSLLFPLPSWFQISSSAPYAKTPSDSVLPSVWEGPSFTHTHTYKTICKITVLYILIFIFLNSRRQDKNFCCRFYLSRSVNSCDVNRGDSSATVDWNSLNSSEGKCWRHYRRILRSVYVRSPKATFWTRPATDGHRIAVRWGIVCRMVEHHEAVTFSASLVLSDKIPFGYLTSLWAWNWSIV